MTKTKLEHNCLFDAHPSKDQQSARAMDSGDAHSHAQLRTHRQSTHQSQTSTKRRSQVPVHIKDAPGRSVADTREAVRTATIRRTPSGGKGMKPENGKRAAKAKQSDSESQRDCTKSPGQRKLSDASNTSDDVSKDSGCTTGKLSSADSSSEISDCTSEENKPCTDAQSSDSESRARDVGKDGEGMMADSTDNMSEIRNEGEDINSSTYNATLTPGFGIGEGSISPGDERSFASLDSRLNFSGSVVFSDVTGEQHEDLVREIDELRSENEYLKDEMEELRAEMLEMRDMYMEEDVYQLQELRQQLEQANKTCRILQYRLRKAERRSLRVAQTGQVDGELIRTLEHDLRVAKSVSVRLHSELEAVQKRKSQLEWENEELRERLQDLEVAKQVLQAEMDKGRENSLKRRSLRSAASKGERRLSSQDDSADLKCQLHFAKEESALMCKKLTKMAVESESMREELGKYRLLYGDVDASQAAAGAASSAHTREAEVKAHLRLVEEEATLLSRRIVELEVENRGLRAEMSELRDRVGAGVGGGGGEEDEEPGEGAGDCLALSLSVREVGEGQGQTREGLLAHVGRVTEPVTKTSPGLNQSWHPKGGRSEGSPGNQNTREGPVGGERDPMEGVQEGAAQSGTNDVKAQPVQHGCSLSLKELEALVAIRDQALLVTSSIQFLTAPSKNGHSCPNNVSVLPVPPYISAAERETKMKTHPLLLDPMLSPLTSGLEVLQAQLRALVRRVETLAKSAPTEESSNGVPTETGGDQAAIEAKESGTTEPPAQPCPAASGHQDGTCDQDSTTLLAHQLRWFLQQWRQGQRPNGEGKNLFEQLTSQKDLSVLMEMSQGGKKTCSNSESCPQEKSNTQTSGAALKDLRAAMLDLLAELLEEQRAGQEVAQQYAQAKASWAVESTQLRSLTSRLEDTVGKAGPKPTPDRKASLQRDHIEKLQHLLAESYAAIMDMTRQLKVRERRWSCERQKLLDHLNQVHVDQSESNSWKYCLTVEAQNDKMSKKGRMCFSNRMLYKVGSTARLSGKNWQYLSQEAALLDRDDPCKTWDCPDMPPSFPGLNLRQTSTLRSHTAPERTTLRIYYSPPSARRVQLTVGAIEREEEECRGGEKLKGQSSVHRSATQGHRNEDWRPGFDCQQGGLRFEYQGAGVARTSSSCSPQPSGISPPSCLRFDGLAVSANLSDDMKEMTACMRQGSGASSLERRQGQGGGGVIQGVVSTSTQTKPQTTSVGLQTEGAQGVHAGRYWSPRITSFVTARPPPISASMDRVSGRAEKPPSCSTSPKLQRRSSSFSTSSSSSSSSLPPSSSSITSSSFPSSSSLTSRLEPRERGLWSLPQRGAAASAGSAGSAWARSATARPGSAIGGSSPKPTNRKTVGIHKYGLVQEFLRNVCGRGEKLNPGGERAPVSKKDHTGPAGLKKADRPPSRVPTVPLVRSDSVTKIVNRRFMKQGQKEDTGSSQSPSIKTTISKDKSPSITALEEGACDCSTRTLTSCFARSSRTTLRHSQGQCKFRLHECPSAAGGKGDPLPP